MTKDKGPRGPHAVVLHGRHGDILAVAAVKSSHTNCLRWLKSKSCPELTYPHTYSVVPVGVADAFTKVASWFPPKEDPGAWRTAPRLAAPYFDPPRYIADNPNGPSMSSKYHTHEDCPSIRGIASEAMKSDIKFLEKLHGRKLELCGLCKRRKS